jgi:hypothetical protein
MISMIWTDYECIWCTNMVMYSCFRRQLPSESIFCFFTMPVIIFPNNSSTETPRIKLICRSMSRNSCGACIAVSIPSCRKITVIGCAYKTAFINKFVLFIYVLCFQRIIMSPLSLIVLTTQAFTVSSVWTISNTTIIRHFSNPVV